SSSPRSMSGRRWGRRSRRIERPPDAIRAAAAPKTRRRTHGPAGMTGETAIPRRSRRSRLLFSALALAALAVLLALGTWQVQRLAWKEALIATISERVASPPRPLAEIETLAAETGDVEYRPVEATGMFLHESESHF